QTTFLPSQILVSYSLRTMSSSSVPTDKSCETSLDVLELQKPLDEIIEGHANKVSSDIVDRSSSPQWSDNEIDTLEELEHFLSTFCPGYHKDFDDFIECSVCLNAMSLSEVVPDNQPIKVTENKKTFKITDNQPKVSSATRSPLHRVNPCHGGVVSKRFPSNAGRRDVR
ncbi:hypothetical protein PRIPAC_85490, partial [Pristionchus pacificus]